MPRTLFEGVRARLLRLVPRFGLSKRSGLILDSYDRICRESLWLTPGSQRPEGCRLNRDGTAIQFSLALSRGRAAALQFLGEAGAPALNDAARAAVGLRTISALSAMLDVETEAAELLNLLTEITPHHEDPLNGSGPGVYWIGVSFPQVGAPALTVYVNTRFGAEARAWERAQLAAAYAGADDSWDRVQAALRGKLAPLGVAFTVSAGRRTAVREYFSSYGLMWSDCRDTMVRASGQEQFGEFLDRYMRIMMAGELRHPLRSAVCSFQFEPDQTVNPKFEICAHCAYGSDGEAAARSRAWVESNGLDSGLYLDTIEMLGAGRRSSPPELHAYMGAGMSRAEPYSTFYLNPGAGVAAWRRL
jgi:hypothetical protein